MLLLAAALPANAADNPPANLIANGGFERWAPLDAGLLKDKQVQNVNLTPPEQGPVDWVPLRELTEGQAPTASIAMDEAVKHSGKRSVRIHNSDPRDVTLVQYSTQSFTRRPDDPHNIKPNRRYLIRWWVKGQDVVPGDAGPILMLYYDTERDGKPARVDTYEQGVPLPQGTFDWQQRQFVFITDAHASSVTLSLQLRWATGTIWYDDVEMFDEGKVVHVETY